MNQEFEIHKHRGRDGKYPISVCSQCGKTRSKNFWKLWTKNTWFRADDTYEIFCDECKLAQIKEEGE